jgi:hypothetical protein
MQICERDPVDKVRVEKFVKLVELAWADNPQHDIRLYQRQVVTDLENETPTTKDIVKALEKWAGHYDGAIGGEEYAIKKAGCFQSMSSMPAIVKEIEVQLAEDRDSPSRPPDGAKRKS